LSISINPVRALVFIDWLNTFIHILHLEKARLIFKGEGKKDYEWIAEFQLEPRAALQGHRVPDALG